MEKGLPKTNKKAMRSKKNYSLGINNCRNCLLNLASKLSLIQNIAFFV